MRNVKKYWNSVYLENFYKITFKKNFKLFDKEFGLEFLLVIRLEVVLWEFIQQFKRMMIYQILCK